jgi:elongator complex protein 4
VKLNNKLYQISSGIQSLDDLLGGGIFLGTITMIKQDRSTQYSSLVLKYFIAQGIVCGHQGCIVSIDSDPNKIKNGLMGLSKLKHNAVAEPQLSTQSRPLGRQLGGLRNDTMKIAWRYQNLGTVSSDFVQNAPVDELYCSTFDLTKKMELESHHMIKTVSESDLLNQGNQGNQDEGIFSNLLDLLRQELESTRSLKKDSPKCVLRIAIDAFASCFWPDMTSEECLDKNGNRKMVIILNLCDSLAFIFFMHSRACSDLIMQLYCLQSLLIYIMIFFLCHPIL